MSGLVILFLSTPCWAIQWRWNPYTNKLDRVHEADEVDTDITNFDNNLSSTDIDVQTALDTLDNAVVTVFGLWQLDAGGNMMPALTSLTDTYWELDINDNLIPKS